MSRFRLVHFAASPAFDAGRPVAALVDDGIKTRCVRTAQLPHVDCVGGKTMHAIMRMGLESLTAASFGVLPSAVGPLFRLGQPMPLPATVGDEDSWLQVLMGTPEEPHTSGDDEPVHGHRAPRRGARTARQRANTHE